MTYLTWEVTYRRQVSDVRGLGTEIPPEVRCELLACESKRLLPECFAEAELVLGQIIEQRADGFDEPLPLRPDQNGHRPHDLEIEPPSHGPCLAIVQDDGPTPFRRQRHGFRFSSIHQHPESGYEGAVRGRFNPEPLRGCSKLLLDRGRSLNGVEEGRQKVEVADAFQGDQAGAVTDDGLLQEPTSARNSSGG